MIAEGSFLSLVPPLVAIVLCILLRQAVIALLAGIFVGAFLLYDFSPWTAFFRTFDEILLQTFIDADNAVVLFFTVLTGGVTGILSGSPAARRLIAYLATRLRHRGKAMVTIWLSGVLFFIDDYANCLVVGNAYRGLCDRLRISREKLAYLVDTTAAPVTSLALVSTWIGVEISLINDSLQAYGNQEYTGYSLFLFSIPYRFYPVLAMVFCLMVCYTGRDIGSMRIAEKRAMESESEIEDPFDSEPGTGVDRWSYLVFLPLLVLVISSVALLLWHGYHNGAPVDWSNPLQTLMGLFAQADPFRCLLWATLIATLMSFVVHLGLLSESFHDVNKTWFEGCQAMFTVCVILTLAWSIGGVCKRLDTGSYVASLLGKGFDPSYLPLLTFLFAAAISFATGTSYGTMSILMPIALPIALDIGAGHTDIIYGTVGSVLGGAIFGDHCSPLSDTTILSAGASGCSVTEHVNTQMPYAIVVGVVSVICLFLVPIQGISAFLLDAIGIIVLAGILWLLGRKTPERTSG